MPEGTRLGNLTSEEAKNMSDEDRHKLLKVYGVNPSYHSLCYFCCCAVPRSAMMGMTGKCKKCYLDGTDLFWFSIDTKMSSEKVGKMNPYQRRQVVNNYSLLTSQFRLCRKCAKIKHTARFGTGMTCHACRSENV